jgi:membrane protein YdbS with pleckstrin-like domain
VSGPSPPATLASDAGGLRAPAERLDPRARLLWVADVALVTAVVVVAGAAALIVAELLAEVPQPPLLWGALVLVAAAGAAVAATVPAVLYRAYRWEVTPLGLYVRRGWIRRTWTVVPHSRIQSIETTIGPLHRLLGLAQVEVRTASGEGGASVPGLSQDLVARLTAQLAAAAGEGDAT